MIPLVGVGEIYFGCVSKPAGFILQTRVLIIIMHGVGDKNSIGF
jgi:hypothetical protein